MLTVPDWCPEERSLTNMSCAYGESIIFIHLGKARTMVLSEVEKGRKDVEHCDLIKSSWCFILVFSGRILRALQVFLFHIKNK